MNSEREYQECARRVLAFDIGIKNLAWCVLEKSGATYKIVGWDNYNLLEEESAGSVGETCSQASCKLKAIYTCGEDYRCGRHVPSGFSLFKDAKGKPLKKLPPVGSLKKIYKETVVGSKVPAGKDALVDGLRHCYAVPIVVKKVVRSADANLTAIHDSMRRLVEARRGLWSGVELACLENQPVFKNPTMKSVQILLFATLRDMYSPSPPVIKLVHAKKKVEDGEKGDKGYKARKEGSETRAAQFLHGSGLSGSAPWIRLWNEAKKKSDLADALCMCLDQLA